VCMCVCVVFSVWVHLSNSAPGVLFKYIQLLPFCISPLEQYHCSLFRGDRGDV